MAIVQDSLFSSLSNLLQQDYRGINIAVYTLAAAGLGFSIHKVRPISKFSKASKVPDHFISNHQPLRGYYAGVQHSPVRILFDHKAPIYLPFWHSSKPPLPVKLWGVEIASGNAINWLQCVAHGKEMTIKPIKRDKEDLVSTVLLHFPEVKTKKVETVDVGRKLVELGFAKITLPEKLTNSALVSAETQAKSLRNGIWSEKLPPLPLYVVYGRKASKIALTSISFMGYKSLQILIFLSKSSIVGLKYLLSKIFNSRKQIHTT